MLGSGCCSLQSLTDPKSFCFQFGATFLTLFLLTQLSCSIGCTVTLIGTGTVFLVLSWTIARKIHKAYFNERLSSLNKAVLVTGCDSGFGHRLANRLNNHGYTVYAACMDPSGEGPQQLLKSAAFPKATKLIKMDVTSDSDVQSALQEISATLKQEKQELWALVNNAGIFKIAHVEWGKLEDFQKVLDVNVIGVTRVTRAFLPLLRKSKGRVVNVASVAGRITGPGLAIYSLSKHAVVALSAALRREMIPWGVKVSTIEPGIYQTPMANKQIMEEGVRKMWSETSEAVRADYGEEYFNAQLRHLLDLDGRNNPEEVVDAQFDAINSVEPEIRYKVCGMDYHIIWLLSDYLPFKIGDCLSKLRSPKVKPKGAQ